MNEKVGKGSACHNRYAILTQTNGVRTIPVVSGQSASNGGSGVALKIVGCNYTLGCIPRTCRLLGIQYRECTSSITELETNLGPARKSGEGVPHQLHVKPPGSIVAGLLYAGSANLITSWGSLRPRSRLARPDSSGRLTGYLSAWF